ncbi:MAG: outer membrane protein assembly factor BamE domain-containing protein [Myxococcota bacterium]
MFRRLVLAVSALLLLLTLACASAGRKVDRAHLDDIQKGAQTKAEIRTWFGEPYTVQPGLAGHPAGCTERWTYEYAKAQGFGTVTYREILVIDFDDDGRVCDHAFSKTGEE